VCVRVRVCACVCVCVRATGLYGHGGGTAATGGIYSSAATCGRTRVRFALVTRPFAHVAAGASWTSPTASAPWAARYQHTTVINATGAIYVIGGFGDGTTYYHDVWLSTDGGADRTRGGVSEEVLTGYSRGSR
jgi:hypothetical protein